MDAKTAIEVTKTICGCAVTIALIGVGDKHINGRVYDTYSTKKFIVDLAKALKDKKEEP